MQHLSDDGITLDYSSTSSRLYFALLKHTPMVVRSHYSAFDSAAQCGSKPTIRNSLPPGFA